jgi:hypothetical protein
MPIADLPRRIYWTFTGDLSDPAQAAHVVAGLNPETGEPGPHLAILDLSGKLLSPASLRELIVSVGQKAQAGIYGDIKLVLVSSDPAVVEQANLLAREHQLPLFIASSRDPAAIEEAVPAGDLTLAERETLGALRRLGGLATVSRFAEAMDLEPSAATNRLVNVDRKGYLYRVERGRRLGDVFVDPRIRRQALVGGDLEDETPPALAGAHGGEPPPSRARIDLEGEAARRAQEIIRRRR